ncbi:hypothetical protein LTR17_022804 [Elasticomyces elasticus]|nr:hypothetical protein LTR17_022804 [Elasticomyces elasticus]
MSSGQTSGRDGSDELDVEMKQMYHDTLKSGGHVDVQIGGDDQDREDMARMGRQAIPPKSSQQQLLQSAICCCPRSAFAGDGDWMYRTGGVELCANTQGLLNGGLAGVFWSYVWTAIGMSTVVASLAEMASMAPTSGGQYHWISEFSPPQYQQFLSYIGGWMSTLSWQATAAGATFVDGIFILGLASAYHPEYVIQGWHGTLVVGAVTILVGIVNGFFADSLPQIQKFMAILFGVGWIPVVVVLIALAPHPPAGDVFTKFSSEGWSPMGLSVMVGQISALYSLVSFDAAAHMSEEVRRAGLAVPRAMMWSYTANAVIGVVVVFAYLYSIPDVDAALSSPTGFPILYVLQSATYWGTLPIAIMLIMIATAGCIGCNASASRETFAFARDDGLPFKNWLAKVTPKSLIPLNSVLITCIITFLLSLINIGSTVAFNAIISLQLIALMATYATSIACVLFKRIKGEHNLPSAQWSLGRSGKAINTVALVYSIYLVFWIGWPPLQAVTPASFNWATPMFGAIFLFSLVFYYTSGRKVYKGPVTLVQA